MRVLPCIIALCVAAAPGAARADLFHLWSQGYGDTLTPGGIAVDNDGSIAVAGHFIGSIDLGGGALTSAGLYDIFLVRLNPDGTHRWSRAFGGAQSQLCHAMAMAPNGDVVITGYFGGTVDFGGGPLVSVDEPDLYLACFDRDGNHRWSRAFPRPQPQYGQDVVVDASGNVVVTGGFLGRVDLGGGLLSSFGAVDAFLARYDALGNHVWSQRFGGVSNEEGRGVATDAAGNIVMMGYFNGAIDLGDGTLASAGDWDIFLARWDASGNVDWSRRFGDRYLDSPVALACAPGGDIVLTGVFSGSIDFGGGAVTVTPPGSAFFLARLGADGSHRWSTAMPPTPYNVSLYAPAAFDDSLLVGGLLRGDVVMQGHGLSATGGSDLMLLAFDAGGTLTHAEVQGGVGSETATHLAPVAGGGVIVAGSYTGVCNAGGNDFPFSAGGSMFVAGYGPEDPSYTPILAFSVSPRGGVVEVRWQLDFQDPAAGWKLMRAHEADSLWTTLDSEAADDHAGAYDDASVLAGESYAYQLVVTRGAATWASRVVNAATPIPAFSLRQNLPNPFRAATSIGYALHDASPVVVTVYDASGRRVARLDLGPQPPGEHRVVWDGRDQAGQPVASGVYFYRLESISATGARKMVRLK